MRIALFLASGDLLARRAVLRASRALLLSACAAAALFVGGAVLILADARTIVERNAFLAGRIAKLEAESRETSGDAEWKTVRGKGAFFSAGLHAGAPGLVETLGSLEAALPEGVLLRQVRLSRAGSLVVEGASKTLGGGEQFRRRIGGAGSRWALSLESLGYDQSRGEYAFRLKGAWGAR